VEHRDVTLALVDPYGTPLGTLRLPRVASPWWQQVDEVVAAARAAHGVHVTVLRLIAHDRPTPPGGEVTYLAEYDGPPPPGLVPVVGRVDWTAPHPQRMPWAGPGGPAATLAWADEVLAARGRTVTAHRQQRSWNLSSVWRLDTDEGPAWLKEVPGFFAHEATVLKWLDRPTTPTLLGAANGRMLLAHVPGTDRYDADAAEREDMLDDLLAIQSDAVARVPELLALGVPDQRFDVLHDKVVRVVEQWGHTLGDDERAALDDLVGALPGLWADVDACGVPDTLVHGDFHPGNVRSDGPRRVIIDWGDSMVGHPAFDLVTLHDRPIGEPTRLHERWCAHWRCAVPGCEPERALALLAPAAALREAVTYAGFLAAIEPSEHPYHLIDVPDGLRRAIIAHSTSPMT
jgi:Phosphotransferase enzyme family